MDDEMRDALERAAADPRWADEHGRRRRPALALVHACAYAMQRAERRWHRFPDPLARAA